jgi:peptidyl-tRNA hydrolase, PTH1 family
MKTKVIVGLGNPGDEYAHTYHNVGVLALETVLETISGNGESDEASGRGQFKKHKQLFLYKETGPFAFVVPLTFMNASGAAVKEALKKFGAGAEDLMVLHDESDLTVGNYKIAKGRGAAGHKGVQSIMDALKTGDFTRVRIGIRPTQETARKKAEEFVLSQIKTADRAVLKKVFAAIADDIKKIN